MRGVVKMKFREKMQQFMYGRYGNDQLSRVYLGITLVLLVLSLFTRWTIIYIAGIALLIYCYYRMFSRNMSKRSAENQWYLKKEMKVRSWWQRRKQLFAGRKDYKIFKCPKCGQKLRVPRHKGKIAIHCRKCGEEFIRKT